MFDSKKEKLTFIDLFAGCGGLSEGFLQSGQYEALAHVEWEVPMIQTLRHRLIYKWDHSEEEALKRVIHFDIQKTDELINGNWSNKIIDDYEKTNHLSVCKFGLKGIVQEKTVDLIIGGPPCQAYSIAGRAQDKNSMKDDYRNYLFESFVKVVDQFKPKVFLFENVPGLLSATPGDKPVTERIFEAFREIGYEIRSPKMQKKSVYSAAGFGVPQNRNRVIIIGVNNSSNLNLEDIYSGIDLQKSETKRTNVFEAIGHLPKYKPLDKMISTHGKNCSHQLIGNTVIQHHEPRFHNNRDIQIFKRWLKDDMNNKSSNEKISFYNELMNKKSNHAKYRNLEWDKPAPTIVAHLHKDGLMFIHPDIEQARSITVKEAALLQSFPEDFQFIGSQGSAFKMIGNAVPPEMAKNIAIAVSNKLLNK
jgi:DNA (cytosine-5)-methyltransferase 1